MSTNLELGLISTLLLFVGLGQETGRNTYVLGVNICVQIL
jgi:hypothetical protein